MKEMESQTKPSLKLQAYQYLKTKILNCEYRPNEFLNEQKLCAEMGNISRTPMRDALGRLEQEGLITILPKKGLMVSGITEEDVHSMFEMRLLVEPYALRTYGSGIPREQLETFAELMHHPDSITDFCESDDEFHELLMSTLPNKYLRSAYDRITGLNAGADYYLTKPFDTRELLACVNALLRRQGAQVNQLTLGNTSLDLSTAALSCGADSIRLSAREFDIMRLLLQAGERNLSKAALLERVWGYDSDAVENHVEVYVCFLRKKLASIGSNIRIESIRRLGYHLEVSGDD